MRTYTAEAENITPMNAVTALNHFHSAGMIRSMSRMPSANRVSKMTGSDIEYSLIKPEQVRCSENYAGHCPRSPAPIFHERALQNGELADKSVQQRQPH